MKFFLSLLLFFILTTSVSAYSCPYNRVNDPFPGNCSLYTDINKDNLCDNSQDLNTNVNINTSLSYMDSYYIFEIILIFIIFQLVGTSFIQYKKLKSFTWRKINLFALLISFSIVFFSSIVFLLNLADIINTENLRFFSWLHIEAGLAMILFCIEHLLRRWKSFKF